MTTILFLHGWHSVPGGVKPTYLKDHGHIVINPKLPDDDFAEAVRIAQTEFDKYLPQVVVGSSRGGAVAMNINSGDARLVLLCPAWKNWRTAKILLKPSTVILHSRADDVIPYSDSEELVRNSELPVYTLIEVGHDHRLADPESLDLMLAACRIDDDDEDDEILCRTGLVSVTRRRCDGREKLKAGIGSSFMALSGVTRLANESNTHGASLKKSLSISPCQLGQESSTVSVTIGQRSRMSAKSTRLKMP